MQRTESVVRSGPMTHNVSLTNREVTNLQRLIGAHVSHVLAVQLGLYEVLQKLDAVSTQSFIKLGPIEDISDAPQVLAYGPHRVGVLTHRHRPGA